MKIKNDHETPGTTTSDRQCCARAVCLFAAVALIGLAADLLTKDRVFHALGMPGEYKAETPELRAVYWVWQDVAGFQTSLNLGALFGFFTGQTAVLVTVSLFFLLGIAAYLVCWAWRLQSPLRKQGNIKSARAGGVSPPGNDRCFRRIVNDSKMS